MACFADNVSQGSVATYAMYGGIFNTMQIYQGIFQW